MDKVSILTANHVLGAILLLALAVILSVAAASFLRHPKSEKLALVQEWLLWAVARAESYLGSGTGEAKLKLVYSWFEMRFPLLAVFLSFDEFKGMVDDALEQLDELLMDDAIVEMVIAKEEKK